MFSHMAVVFNGMLLEFSSLLRLQPVAEHKLITAFTHSNKLEVERWWVYDVRQLILSMWTVPGELSAWRTNFQLYIYIYGYVTLSAKTRIVRTSMQMHSYWKKKQNCEITHATQKIFTRIDGASNQWSKLHINKNYMPSYSPGYGEFENLYFVSVAWTVSVSRAFVYNAVDVNKIATAFLAKPQP